jgi:putative nucleotidyltransferase with HDIG domain
MPETLLSHTLPAWSIWRCQQLAARLEQHFETPFALYVKDDDWVLASETDDPLPLAHASPILEASFRTLRPRIADVNGRTWLIVPAIEDGVRLVAVGSMASQARFALPLAAALLTSWQQQHEIDQMSEHLREYASQVTNDFEELTWLRGLAEHIDVCELNNDLTTVAGAILPGLRELVMAEALLLYETDQDGSTKLARQIGDAGVHPRTGLDIIARTGSRAIERPVICNAPNAESVLQGLNGVRNFLLTRMAKGPRQFGWLLALNKQCSDFKDSLQAPGGRAGMLGNSEFGTLEAGLLNAAAIMLAAHANNNASFRQVEQLLVGVIRAMINAVDAKDAYTRGHSDRVALIAKRIARQLGLSRLEQERVYMAGLLHDIGKIGVPDHVLGKPDRLTDDEFAQIKRHPEIGCEILKHLQQLHYVLPGVLHHHESVDGRGYPHGLVGESIPLIGRLLAVADAYDAMTSTRPYRTAMSAIKAESILRAGARKQWDEDVVRAFFECLDDVHQLCRSNRAPRGTRQTVDRAAENASADEIANAVMTTLT